MMKPDFNKSPDGLLPAVMQDDTTGKVLMLGYMNAEALRQTEDCGKVVFFSRSRQRLWMKGESSGNFLTVKAILPDCDNDSLLIKVVPAGPVCHSGTDTCFAEENSPTDFIKKLEGIISLRKNQEDAEGSYTAALFKKGVNKIAQKVGEEAVELVIEAKDNDIRLFKNEAADLLFHYLILLQAKGLKLDDISAVLKERNRTNG